MIYLGPSWPSFESSKLCSLKPAWSWHHRFVAPRTLPQTKAEGKESKNAPNLEFLHHINQLWKIEWYSYAKKTQCKLLSCVSKRYIIYLFMTLQWSLFKSAPGAVVMLHLDSLPPTPRRSQNVPQIMPIAMNRPCLEILSNILRVGHGALGRCFNTTNYRCVFLQSASSIWASSSSVTCTFKCKTWHKICCPLLLRHAHWLLLHMYICILDILLIFADPHTDYGIPCYINNIPNCFVPGPVRPPLAEWHQEQLLPANITSIKGKRHTQGVGSNDSVPP